MRAALLRRRRLLAAGGRDFLPTDLSTLLGWWKADAGTFQTEDGTASAADGDPIGEWEDQSGNGSHLLQATAGLRPVLKTAGNGINSLPVVRFDGADDYLSKAAITPSSSFTLFMVLKRKGAAGGSYHGIAQLGFTNYTTSGTDWFQLFDNGTNLAANFDVDTLDVPGDPLTLDAATLVTFRKDNSGGGTSQLWIDEVSAGTGTGNETIAATGFFLGSWNSNDYNGDVAEIVLCDAAIPQADLDRVESYLKGRYAL